MSVTPSDAVEYDLFSVAFDRDPYPTYARMRERDPVYWHPQLRMWFLTRFDDVSMVASSDRMSVERLEVFLGDASSEKANRTRRFLEAWFALRDAPVHTQLKALLAGAFTTSGIQYLHEYIERSVNELIDAVADSGRADVMYDITFPLSAAVISHMLGVSETSYGHFKGWTERIMHVVGHLDGPREDAIAVTYEGILGMEGYFGERIAERRQAPTHDVLSQLVHAEADGRHLSDHDLISMSAMLMAGGYENTALFLCNSVVALLDNPDQLEHLLADPTVISQGADELLRYCGPNIQLGRIALEDMEIGGQLIQRGQAVTGLNPAANRDPAVFENPDVLDLDRPIKRHLALGFGRHMCIGAALARLETRIALPLIMKRMPNMRIVEPPEYTSGLFSRGPRHLDVSFDPGH